MSNKDFFINRYKLLGESPKDVIIKPSLRVNTLNISEKDLISRLENLGVKLEKVSFAKYGYYFNSKFSLGAISEYLLGYFYLQESAAQIPVQVLDPKENDLVLDCCASPGGKTSQISQWMNNKGSIVALEKKQHRIKSLKVNLERMGCSNVVALNMDVSKVEKLDMQFDKILVDAPCSGNFADDKNWFNKRDIDGVNFSSKIQKEILASAVKVLKKDGILVYSTCTLEPEENELNMQWLISNFNVKLEPVNLDFGSSGLTDVFGKKLDKSVGFCRRFWPWRTNTQGFFVAKVRKL